MEQQADLITDNIEVVPVVVLSQTFPRGRLPFPMSAISSSAAWPSPR